MMGTPHSGSGIAKWAQGLAISIGLVNDVSRDMLRVLRRESQVLSRIEWRFHNLRKERAQKGIRPIDIVCCFEELPLPVGGLVRNSFDIHDEVMLTGGLGRCERIGNSSRLLVYCNSWESYVDD